MRETSPEEWGSAVEFDLAIRRKGTREGGPEKFLHGSLLPLGEADLDKVKPDSREEEGDSDGCSPYGCRSGEKA